MFSIALAFFSLYDIFRRLSDAVSTPRRDRVCLRPSCPRARLENAPAARRRCDVGRLLTGEEDLHQGAQKRKHLSNTASLLGRSAFAQFAFSASETDDVTLLISYKTPSIHRPRQRALRLTSSFSSSDSKKR